MRRTTRGETGRAAKGALCALAALVALAAFAGGCAGGGAESNEPDELSPAELGQLGGRIHQEPERADEILVEAGLTAEELEEQVREVTADPDASRAYAEGFRAVAGEEPNDGA